MEPNQQPPKPPQSNIALQVFLGLFLFFVILPIGTCVACTTCATVAGQSSR